MTLFSVIYRPISQKKISPAEFRAFQHGLFCGRYLFPCWPPYFRAQNSLAAYFGSTLFLCSFLLSFPFEFMYFIMQKTVIFIYISANRIQHKFLVYFFCRSITQLPPSEDGGLLWSKDHFLRLKVACRLKPVSFATKVA